MNPSSTPFARVESAYRLEQARSYHRPVRRRRRGWHGWAVPSPRRPLGLHRPRPV